MSLAVDSQPFDLAGLPARIQSDDEAVVQAGSAAGLGPAWTLGPDDWPAHAALSSIRIRLVDSEGIVVQRLPGPAVANLTTSLCFLTSAADEFYCRGEARDHLLFPGGSRQDGTIERPVS
jgi:hypothetical protein